ncbi:DUF4811 domain-containing protein [Secundilactobacillus paracollinoides]|uniref:DUF4811 domain-containing protein n=1 Tax=Secundilactobacillus paracollinoides TaxID=240427 RepID=A0A1B2IZI0_9LACO|nr:DUF4811 domain-containing protein [Secundilactobacillus paracollinoides]ANZ61542.1 hypothetical protein AYR61_09360 [Secundilactobacillus paracollinoides]ANZ67463.1 hypothetical protein AYR63_10110 [Secundilactobacillus paracollinoides]
MIILFLLIMIVLFCFSTIMLFKNKYYGGLALISLIAVCGSLWLIYKNDNDNLGMHLKTDTTKVELDSSYASPIPMIVYKQLGTTQNMSERIYLFKPSVYGTLKKTSQSHFHIKVVDSNKKEKSAKLMTQTRRYEYKNKLCHILFLGSTTNRRQSSTYTFEIPQNWLVVEVKQAKLLPEMIKREQSKVKVKVNAYIKTEVQKKVMQAVKMQAPELVASQLKQAIETNPSLLTNQASYNQEKRIITEKVTSELKVKTMKQVKNNDLPEIKQQGKAYGKQLLIKSLKQELGS